MCVSRRRVHKRRNESTSILDLRSTVFVPGSDRFSGREKYSFHRDLPFVVDRPPCQHPPRPRSSIQLGKTRCIRRSAVVLRAQITLSQNMTKKLLYNFLMPVVSRCRCVSKSAQPRDLSDKKREKTTNASSNIIATPWLQRILSLVVSCCRSAGELPPANIKYSISR